MGKFLRVKIETKKVRIFLCQHPERTEPHILCDERRDEMRWNKCSRAADWKQTRPSGRESGGNEA